MQTSKLTPIEAKMQADYDAIAKAFSLSRAELHWPEVDREIIALKPGMAMLDVGCGMGRLYNTAKAAGLTYAGVDISAQQIAEGKRLNPQADLEVGSMLHLPYEDASFDAVFMVASFHHLATVAERRQAVVEAMRVLKPGGIVVVTVMALWQKKYWPLFMPWAKGKKRGFMWRDVFVPWRWKVSQPIYRYYHAFRMNELRRLFAKGGAQVDRVEYVRDGVVSPAQKAKNLVLVARKIV